MHIRILYYTFSGRRVYSGVYIGVQHSSLRARLNKCDFSQLIKTKTHNNKKTKRQFFNDDCMCMRSKREIVHEFADFMRAACFSPTPIPLIMLVTATTTFMCIVECRESIEAEKCADCIVVH